MKLDGVSMETTEPAEPSSSQDMPEQASSKADHTANDAAPTTAPKANGKPLTSEPKVKPKAVASKTQHTGKSTGASVANSRPGTTSHRMLNDIKSSNNVSAAAVKKTTITPSKASTSGAVPKRPLGLAGVSTTVKSQTRVPDKKSVGPTRTTSVAAATATNGTKPTPMNGASKKGPVAETVSAIRPKTTATPSRTGVSTAPKPSPLTSTKTRSTAVLKTTRPATAPSTARPASTTPRGTAATSKASTNAAAKTSASRVTTAPSTGRTTATQLPKSAAAKKDVSQPPSATVAKKPTTGTSGVTKKPEPSKAVATAKLNAVPKNSAVAKATEPKVSQPKTQSQPPTKKPVASTRFPAINKPPLGRTAPTSSVSKPANGGTPQAKRGNKPTQAVPPFTSVKKTGVSSAATPDGEAQSAAGAAVAAVAAVAAATAAAVLAETQADSPVASPQEPTQAAPAQEEVPPPLLAQDTPPLVVPQEPEQSHAAVPTLPKSPVSAALPQTPSNQEQLETSPLLLTQEQIPDPAEPTSPPVASPLDQSDEPAYLLSNQTPSTSKTLIAASNGIPQIIPPPNLNEEEDEEERERSQLVSMSEMSGTTQATEESHPGSAGPVGGSAWRASGALLSELDSEDVSGSQQGASDFSTPGVMEGTESMDDLGDGSLKGAIDMEGASAGSPDSEKVPDIPVNDYDEEEDDDYDDNDHVCDMDVGSERTDELQRPRHDNDVDDEEEDEDVEMASEGVTESGLESYGNADEDDFAEDERLDNLNRVAQPPPPPPQLPAAPAAQWDQPNPFADYWAEPLQPQQVLQPVSQEEGAAAASPVVDPYQADSETPTQTTAQAWLEFGSASFVNENQDAPHHPSVQDEPQNVATQMYLDHPSPALMQTQAPAPLSATGMSLSSTLSSETSTPEELGDYKRDGKLQSQDAQVSMLSPRHDLDYQDLGIHERRDRDVEVEEEAEAKTLPADEVLGGPTTAPTSNPSSASVTEDEASDTEGEAQLDDSLDSPAVSNVTFEGQPPGQRCLSTVEEGEEAEIELAGAGEDTTPPSATSLASYGFDTMTTASNSNAQSTGESCIKSPGIFSLEELPEESKEPCLIPEPLDQPCLAEQQYIECGKQGADSAGPVQEEVPGSQEDLSTLGTFQQPEENPDDIQAPYYSAICEKTENSFAGLNALPHPHRRDHAAYPRTYCDIVIPHGASVGSPKLTCADLPPRNQRQQALSPQLLRLEQHQRQLLEMQQRRDHQSKPLEEVEQERKKREEEEQRKKKEEAEEEIKRNKEEESQIRKQAEITKKEEEEKVRKEQELKQRRDLELQLQQQQQELKQRQQIMQWQQELQQSNKGQTVLLSPSSGLCTIYEALENSEEEAEDTEEGIKKEEPKQEISDQEAEDDCERVLSDEDQQRDSAVSAENPAPHQDSPHTPSSLSQDRDSSFPPESPDRPAPLDLDWGKKADIVQQLINQTLLLNGDSCSSLLLMPGGAGGTLSPLESSLWPSLLPPLTPPSATVTSVSSFSPEATGSSPQGEWTVVELETHH